MDIIHKIVKLQSNLLNMYSNSTIGLTLTSSTRITNIKNREYALQPFLSSFIKKSISCVAGVARFLLIVAKSNDVLF